MREKAWKGVSPSLPQGGCVLDLGCGAAGVVGKLVLSDERKLKLTGVDISERQIELAREQFGGDGGGGGEEDRCVFLVGDMGGASFAPLSFDLVVAFFSVFHLPREEHKMLFQKVTTWLKPGGTFLFNLGNNIEGEGDASFSPDFCGAPMVWSSYGRDETVRLLGEVGLVVVGERVEVVKEGNGVDGAGIGFRFFTAVKRAN